MEKQQNIINYINKCIDKNIPIVAICEADKDFIIDYIKKEYNIYYDVTKNENIIISCRHYPFTCEEADKYIGNSHMSFERVQQLQRDCDCIGEKACQEEHSRYYHDFSWEDEYMEHDHNCYNDCGCMTKIFERYLIIYY